MGEKSLTLSQAKRMLEVAKQRNLRDYLIYKLMAARGFRIGEVLGTPSRKREGKKWIRLNEPTNPGLMVKDLTNEGVWVRKKDKPAELRPLESEDVLELRELIGKRRSGRVFPITQDGLAHNTRMYARQARFSKITPQMFHEFHRNAVKLHSDLDEQLGLSFTSESLMRLIREGESERVEFKVEIGNPSELCESIVGFANLRGGDILIGVDDNGVVRGIPEKDSKIEERITYFTREFCSPNVWVTMDTVETKGMRVLVLHVSEGGYGKPFWLKDKGPIIRSGKTDRLMTREEAELSFLDSSLG